MNSAKMALLVAGTVALHTAACAQNGALDEEALGVVERTRAATATYSSYNWNRITRAGQPAVEEWSAEFHAGSRHRVETPRERLIADCVAMTGTALSLASGEKISGRGVAAAACGINANKPFRSARLIGPVEASVGAADRVEVSDQDYVRTYDVTRDGIIVRGTYASVATPDAPDLVSWTVALEREVPSDDMFSEQSLSRSFVPEKFRVAPGSAPD